MNINNKATVKKTLLSLLSVLIITSCSAKKPINSNPNYVTQVAEETENVTYYNPTVLEYKNKTYSSSIKTVRLHKKGWELSDPVINLNEPEQLELHFDELNGEFTNYQYSIYHCTKNWEKSSLNEMEYIDGFNENTIDYQEPSFNSLQNYIHYAVVFPNDDIKITKSGNYILIVYPEDDIENPIITRRMYVTEEAMTLNPRVKYPSDVSERYYKQEVDFNIFFTATEILNPYDNIKVVIEQNHRPDNVCDDLEPNFVKENQLVYNAETSNVFEAGNEYRHLDLTNIQGRTTQVAKFVTLGDTLHGYMLHDLRRQFKKYLQYEDINGRYVTRNINGQDAYLESSYVLVHFSLPYPNPILNGGLYIFGELSDYQYKEEFKMRYNYKAEAYQCAVYLKQGYYNYNYAFVGNKDSETNFETVEGTHFDTENDYIFKVYYTDPIAFYDKLMLYQTVKSRDDF